MRKYLLILFAIFGATFHAAAQNAIAQIKYEEAEEAFNNNDYATAILRLDEADAILKEPHPKIMYLKILGQGNAIIEKPYKDYLLLQDARKNCIFFLKEYADMSVEEKYKDIFKMYEKLKAYPTTLEEWELKKEKTTIEDRPVEDRQKLGRSILQKAADAVASSSTMASITDLEIKYEYSIKEVANIKFEIVQKYILPDTFLQSYLYNGMLTRSAVLKNNELSVFNSGKSNRTGSQLEKEEMQESAHFFYRSLFPKASKLYRSS